MIGLLEVPWGRQVLLHLFACGVWNTKQIQCTWFTNPHELTEKVCWRINVLHNLHGNNFIGIGVWQW